MRQVSMMASLVLCGFWILPTVGSCNSQYTDTYDFPVVASGNGVNGSVWRTEVCINTPHDRPLEIMFMAISDDDLSTVEWVHLPEFDVICFDDVLEDVFNISGSKNLIITAREQDNPTAAHRVFSASARVYNLSQDGSTFGQEIPPINTYGDLGGLVQPEGEEGLFSGVHNFGTSSGFRTNIGLTSLYEYAQIVRVIVIDHRGYFVWESDVTVGAYDQVQFRIPQNVVITNGAVMIKNARLISPYISVVDNKSGDGLFRAMLKNHYGKSQGVQPGNEIASRLLDLVKSAPGKAAPSRCRSQESLSAQSPSAPTRNRRFRRSSNSTLRGTTASSSSSTRFHLRRGGGLNTATCT